MGINHEQFEITKIEEDFNTSVGFDGKEVYRVVYEVYFTVPKQFAQEVMIQIGVRYDQPDDIDRLLDFSLLRKEIFIETGYLAPHPSNPVWYARLNQLMAECIDRQCKEGF
jgi:hypothetical protein